MNPQDRQQAETTLTATGGAVAEGLRVAAAAAGAGEREKLRVCGRAKVSGRSHGRPPNSSYTPAELHATKDQRARREREAADAERAECRARAAAGDAAVDEYARSRGLRTPTRPPPRSVCFIGFRFSYFVELGSISQIACVWRVRVVSEWILHVQFSIYLCHAPHKYLKIILWPANQPSGASTPLDEPFFF